MIFVNVTLEEWLSKHPDLKIIEETCDGCGREIKATRPFVTKGYAGLRGTDCDCGNGRHTVMSLVTTSAEKHYEWIAAVSPTDR